MFTILATLPAEVERTFSKVERTLTSQCSTMSEERLYALIMLQAHRELLPSTDAVITVSSEWCRWSPQDSTWNVILDCRRTQLNYELCEYGALQTVVVVYVFGLWFTEGRSSLVNKLNFQLRSNTKLWIFINSKCEACNIAWACIVILCAISTDLNTNINRIGFMKISGTVAGWCQKDW